MQGQTYNGPYLLTLTTSLEAVTTKSAGERLGIAKIFKTTLDPCDHPYEMLAQPCRACG